MMTWFGGELYEETTSLAPSWWDSDLYGPYYTFSTVNNVSTLSLVGEWTTATPMLTKRHGHCVVVFNESVAIIIGTE